MDQYYSYFSQLNLTPDQINQLLQIQNVQYQMILTNVELLAEVYVALQTYPYNDVYNALYNNRNLSAKEIIFSLPSMMPAKIEIDNKYESLAFESDYVESPPCKHCGSKRRKTTSTVYRADEAAAGKSFCANCGK